MKVDSFLVHSNIVLYLDRLSGALDTATRLTLQRLLAEEVAKLGASQEDRERGDRYIADIRARIEQHIATGDQPLIATLQTVQSLLEKRLRR